MMELYHENEEMDDEEKRGDAQQQMDLAPRNRFPILLSKFKSTRQVKILNWKGLRLCIYKRGNVHVTCNDVTVVFVSLYMNPLESNGVGSQLITHMYL